MLILITKQNADYFKEKMKAKSLNVVDQTAHTITVKLSTNRFNKLYEVLKNEGQNPYALMHW